MSNIVSSSQYWVIITLLKHYKTNKYETNKPKIECRSSRLSKIKDKNSQICHSTITQ